MELVVSDAHHGLGDAIAKVFAGATCQRCRTHSMTNLLNRVPKSAQPGVATIAPTLYRQITPEEAYVHLGRMVDQLQEPFPQVAPRWMMGCPDILAFTGFPVSHWQKLWSNNPLERLNKEIRRRTDVVGIFLNWTAAPRPLSAVLAKQLDEWTEDRHYLTIHSSLYGKALPESSVLQAAD